MKRLTLLILTASMVLFALFWTDPAGHFGGDGLSWARDHVANQYAPRSEGVFERPHHPQRPAAYGFFYYGQRPPHMNQHPWNQHLWHQHFWHPARPGHHPGAHHHYPIYPFYIPLLPYPLFLPYSEPGPTPWFDDEILIPAGRLHLLVDPVHAQAFVDGYPLERNPDLSYEVGLLEGEHQVEITAEGYAPFQQTVTIKGGRMLRLNIRLEREGGP